MEQIEKKLPERKENLGKALEKMAYEVSGEIDRGEYVTFDKSKEALECE
ncbi:hypothetical protein ACOI1C_18350 [Bacillus sp. DJP31]